MSRIEVRIVKTLMSRKPNQWGILFGGTLILLSSLLSLRAWEDEALFQWAMSSRDLVFQQGQYYRLITAIFLHGDLGHLLSNSYMLLVLSIFVFGTLGISNRGSFVLLLYSFLGAVAVQAMTLMSYPAQVGLLGASGWVYLLAGFWFFNYLWIDRRRKFFNRWIRVIGVSLVILFPTTFEENVSYLAHLYGFIVGALFALGYFITMRSRVRQFEEVQILNEEFLPEEPLD
ncbi:MAG: hypothetical protein CL676_00260 [Bdellovibrionaceae bacterium]|nr:hypothetical protein [Pseudobdellovibrionaceae bacterium]